MACRRNDRNVSGCSQHQTTQRLFHASVNARDEIADIEELEAEIENIKQAIVDRSNACLAKTSATARDIRTTCQP
jgi:hypothetical protein